MGLFQFSGAPAGHVTTTGTSTVGEPLRQPAFNQISGTLGGDYLYGNPAFNAAH